MAECWYQNPTPNFVLDTISKFAVSGEEKVQLRPELQFWKALDVYFPMVLGMCRMDENLKGQNPLSSRTASSRIILSAEARVITKK